MSSEVVRAVTDATRRSVAEGVKAASRRLLVEVLQRSGNVGLREYRVPSLHAGDIGGNCAASWSLDVPAPAVARDTGRGWRMDGTLPATCNLPGQWFLLSVPVRFEGASDHSLVLLEGEADGLHRRDEPLPGLEAVDRASLVLDRVFLREDELITSHATPFLEALVPFSLALRCAILAGACLSVVDGWDESSERDERLSAVEALVRQAGAALDTLRPAHEVGEVMAALQRQANALSWWPLSRATPVGAEDRLRLSRLGWLWPHVHRLKNLLQAGGRGPSPSLGFDRARTACSLPAGADERSLASFPRRHGRADP